MRRTRVLRQRPLVVRKETTAQKMCRGLEKLRREKMIRQMVIDIAHKREVDTKDDG